jgi:MFS family permease
VMVAAIHPPAAARSVAQGEHGNLRRELGEGVRFFVSNRTLRTLTITICIAMLGFGALKVLNVFFVQDNLHSGTVIYAWLMAASGIGAVGGALVAAGPVRWLGAGRAFGLATIAIGVCLIVFSRMSLAVPALALVFVAGVMEAVVNVATGPILLTATPRAMVGRISSLLNPLVTLVALLSVIVAGWLDSSVLRGFNIVIVSFTFGPVDTIYALAGLIAILAGVYALRNLRGMQGQPE